MNFREKGFHLRKAFPPVIASFCEREDSNLYNSHESLQIQNG